MSMAGGATAASPAAASSEPVPPPPVVRSLDNGVRCWPGTDKTGEVYIDNCWFRRSSDGAHHADLYAWDANSGNGTCVPGSRAVAAQHLQPLRRPSPTRGR
ncbi:hypothetical protein [Nonomuraea sp. KM88]|uniref:hypothetical protein n=1 Tax=Nonomuraea sp. KM88 TaxID=3457427 RepID=UPI003FCD09F2